MLFYDVRCGEKRCGAGEDDPDTFEFGGCWIEKSPRDSDKDENKMEKWWTKSMGKMWNKKKRKKIQ